MGKPYKIVYPPWMVILIMDFGDAAKAETGPSISFCRKSQLLNSFKEAMHER